jgi:peptidoglycan/xylan/chitin deacetylase (PgdA/CDA1 family)
MAQKYSLPAFFTLLVFLCGSFFFRPVTANGRQADRGPRALQEQEPVRVYDVIPQPMVTLSFDDDNHSVYDTAFPILEASGLPASFYFIGNSLTEEWKTRLKFLEDQGWEIGSHSQTHPDLTTLSDAELEYELQQSKAELEAAGLTVSGFAYPEGSGTKDGRVLRQVKQYYDYARSASSGYNSPIVDQYTLRIQSQVSFVSLETMKDWVDEAIENHQWLIILMHAVDNSGEVYSITPANLTALTGYIKEKVDAGYISAVTTREGLQRSTQEGWVPVNDLNHPIEHDLVLTNSQLLWYFGEDAIDYLYDGHEWVENGEVQYYQWHGDYHNAGELSDVSLVSLNPDRAEIQFILTDSINGDFNVVSTVALERGRSLAEVKINAINGSASALALAKYLDRRFSTIAGEQMGDGWLETGMRNYGETSGNWIVYDDQSDLLRVINQRDSKLYSEYADYTEGEFRVREISQEADIPYTWCVGGIPFDTLNLLSEAEQGVLQGSSTFYTGDDASPLEENTGVVLDTSGEALTLQFTAPASGNYVLSVRQKGNSSAAQYSYQIDGGQATTHTVSGADFGYDNLSLRGLAPGSHTIRLSRVGGVVIFDYVLLTPTSRTASTPADVIFPVDLSCTTSTFFPLTVQGQ